MTGKPQIQEIVESMNPNFAADHRRLSVLPWGADLDQPGAIILLSAIGGSTLATTTISAVEWRANVTGGMDRMLDLVAAKVSKMVAETILGTDPRTISSGLQK